MPNAWLDYPFGEGVAVYKAGAKPDGKMFALISEGKQPVRLSLKCDPELSKLLREKYDEIMPGYHLNKKHWNTLVLSGQLPWEEVQGLIRHSHQLVVG
jgi:predicted DNA-binding protein (MmcQ/YjbR family)